MPSEFKEVKDEDSNGIWLEGGSGTSIEEAIIIRGALLDLVGTCVEFQWLTEKFGQKDETWNLVSHSHGCHEQRDIDTVVIRLASGEKLTTYFDVTESFGKM